MSNLYFSKIHPYSQSKPLYPVSASTKHTTPNLLNNRAAASAESEISPRGRNSPRRFPRGSRARRSADAREKTAALVRSGLPPSRPAAEKCTGKRSTCRLHIRRAQGRRCAIRLCGARAGLCSRPGIVRAGIDRRRRMCRRAYTMGTAADGTRFGGGGTVPEMRLGGRVERAQRAELGGGHSCGKEDLDVEKGDCRGNFRVGSVKCSCYYG